MSPNLSEGLLRHGTRSREFCVGLLVHAVRDGLGGDDQALDWLGSADARLVCALVGYPTEVLRARVLEIAQDPDQLDRFAQLLWPASEESQAA